MSKVKVTEAHKDQAHKLAFQWKADQPQICVFGGYARMSSFCFCDLDLDPTTLVYDIDIGYSQDMLAYQKQTSHGL